MRRAVAGLADQNPVRAQAHGCFQKAGHIDVIDSPQWDYVRGATLQLARVLDDDNTVLRGDGINLEDDGVSERGFAGSCTTHNKDVAAFTNGFS